MSTRCDSADSQIACSCDVLGENTTPAIDSHILDLDVASNRCASDYYADGGRQLGSLILDGY